MKDALYVIGMEMNLITIVMNVQKMQIILIFTILYLMKQEDA